MRTQHLSPRLIPFLMFVAVLAVATATGWGDTPPPNIRIEIQMVLLPQAIGRSLIPELNDEGRIESAYGRIQELLEKGEARLLGWPILTTQSGSRATVEAIQEIRYPTEYESGSAESKDVPSAFETRNVGITVEVEPTHSEDHGFVRLNIVPQHVRLEGFHPVKMKMGTSIASVEQPTFEVMKVTTSLLVRNGGRVLMGVFAPQGAPDHLELFILKAEILPVK